MAPGKKRAPSVVSEKAPPFEHAGSCFVKVLCLAIEKYPVPTGYREFVGKMSAKMLLSEKQAETLSAIYDRLICKLGDLVRSFARDYFNLDIPITQMLD